MFDITYMKIQCNEIDKYIRKNKFIKNYILLKNNNDEHTYNYIENNGIAYDNKIFKIDELILNRTSFKDTFNLIGYGYDSLIFSEKSLNKQPTTIDEERYSIVSNPTMEDIINNIPYYSDIVILDVNNIKELRYNSIGVIIKLLKNAYDNIVINKNDFILIFNKDKNLYYFQ